VIAGTCGEHTKRRDHEVADALVVIAEHAAGVTTTGPLCPAVATVLVFVARNAGPARDGAVRPRSCSRCSR
jgi:hypothetical protein